MVNLSLFADPYLYYCANVVGQRAILKSLRDAARYAQQRGVVIVAAAGNEAQDLGHPTIDDISPDWPPDSGGRPRQVRNSCRVAPAELPGVVTVSAVGVEHPRELLERRLSRGRRRPRRGRTADAGQRVRSRPDSRRMVEHGRDRLLAECTGLANRAIESGGGRYVWISGTSMASPHVAGVAALIRSAHPGMPQGAVAALIRASATPTPCPTDWPAGDPRQCTGGRGQTSFFGAGIVNAEAAVR